jgi:Protein of unknown function (DUF3011)
LKYFVSAVFPSAIAAILVFPPFQTVAKAQELSDSRWTCTTESRIGNRVVNQYQAIFTTESTACFIAEQECEKSPEAVWKNADCFAVRSEFGPRIPTDPIQKNTHVLTCAAYTQDEKCVLPNRKVFLIQRVIGIEVLKEYSNGECDFGESFGTKIEGTTQYLWVKKGCQAKFEVTFEKVY